MPEGGDVQVTKCDLRRRGADTIRRERTWSLLFSLIARQSAGNLEEKSAKIGKNSVGLRSKIVLAFYQRSCLAVDSAPALTD
jgi:hypothetical protein